MKTSFTAMSLLAEHTRLSPAARIDRLLGLNRRFHESAAVQKEFREWNMELERDLLRVPGRLLPRETILYGCGASSEVGPNGEWTRDLRDNKFFCAARIQKWWIVAPERLVRETRVRLY